ncbi:MAG: hypothetical protein ACO1OO_11275 [Flavisolibacter sp.]
MNNQALMSSDFERQKNLKASAYTLAISAGLFLFFMLVKMTTQVAAQEPVVEVIEVNLGSDDTGSGTDQPQLPGNPAPEQQTAYVPPAPTQSNEPAVRDVDAEETHPDAPAVIKPTVSKPDAKKINAEAKTTRTNTTPQPVTAPPAPRPRAVMGQVRGGNGNGGNGADSYKPGSNEGIAGGTGDQGRIGGSPTGTDYTGKPRQLAVRIVSINAKDFVDDFKESGKVMLDITVNENGRLISANYQPRNSTITNRNQIAIAQRRAAEIEYPKVPGGFKQTLRFNFQVK